MLKSITPSELLKMHAKKLNSMIASRKSTTENSLKPTDSLALKQSADAFEATPKLGRGYHPGDKLDLNVDFRRKRLHAAQVYLIITS